MNFKLIIILAIIAAGIFLLKNMGYYQTSCTCSYTFRLTKSYADCAMYCSQYKPLTPSQEIINKLLGK